MSVAQSTAHAAESNVMTAWVAKWPAVSFYTLTLALSWGYWLTLLAQGRRVEPGWLFALICGAFVLAQVYLATGHSILCVALWHVAFNMMVSTEFSVGLPAAIVSSAVMACGLVVAVRWWRRPPDPPRFDPMLDLVTPRAGVGEGGL